MGQHCEELRYSWLLVFLSNVVQDLIHYLLAMARTTIGKYQLLIFETDEPNDTTQY